MSLPIHDKRFVLDLAGPADNADICRLFKEVHVKGELDVNQERDPDFFALQRLQGGPGMTFLARDLDGRAAAIGSIVLRDAWLDGEPTRTGYLCDLRVRPGFRGGVSLARCFDPVLAQVQQDHGVDVFTTVVFDDNPIAHKTLRGPAAERRGQPVYRTMTPFLMTSVQVTRPRGAPGTVRPATAADLPELRDFLAHRGRRRVLGEDFSGDLLDRRLETWPGLSLDDFLLAHRQGRIVGCLAPWDTEPVKRTRVLGYHGTMLWVKRAFNAGAVLLRYPALPPEGECLRFVFLTHLEVEDDDPRVLRALVQAAYHRLYDRRYHFLAAFVPRGSALEGAFSGFMVQHTAMTLYAVARRSSPMAAREWRTDHPGFEMALS